MKNSRHTADNTMTSAAAPIRTTSTGTIVNFVTRKEYRDSLDCTSTSSTTSSITRIRAFSEMQAILDAYRQSIGDSIPVLVGNYIKEIYFSGMSANVIINAINETGWAERPSPQYLRAILSRYQRQGIRTMEQIERERGGRARKPNTETRRGMEHNYIEEDFGPDFYYDPAKDYPAPEQEPAPWDKPGFFYDLDHDYE